MSAHDLTSAFLIQHWPLPQWIAHRGAGRLAPENTLAAFRVGAAYGYRAFECDVKLSADGRPFLLHDSTLDRTTSGTGLAGEQAWEALSRLDAGAWHSRTYAGEPPASLEAIARFVQSNGFALNIEIKPTPGSEQHTGEVVGAQAARLWPRQSSGLLFSSFRPEALLGAKTTAPHVPRALLLDKLWPGWWEAAQQLGCGAIVTNYNIMSASLMERAHAAGMRALVYTVNDPAPAAWLLKLGIDGIITDAVDRFPPAAASEGVAQHE
jgi:glycerophosphoryl diester phosphodiesterase